MNPTFSGLFALFLFSIGTLLVALSGDIPPFQLTAIVTLISAGLLYVSFHFMGRDIKGTLLPIAVKDYALVFLGVGGYIILLHMAFKSAPAFEVNMINYLWPILFVGCVKVVKTECLRRHEALGLVFGFIGIGLIFYPGQQPFFETILIGHYYAIGAAVLWALYSAIASKKHYPATIFIPIMFVTGILSLFAHLAFEETIWDQPFLIWVAVIILSLTRFGYAFWDYAMQNGDQVLLGSLSFLVPLLSTFYFIAFGFTPSRIEVAIGGACILGGCISVNWTHILSLLKKNRVKKNAAL